MNKKHKEQGLTEWMIIIWISVFISHDIERTNVWFTKLIFTLLYRYYKPTFIREDFILRFTGDKLVWDHFSYFSRSRFIHTRFDITPVDKSLVNGERYLFIQLVKKRCYILNPAKIVNLNSKY